MTRRGNYIWHVALLMAVYVLYLVCNMLTPMVVDDCSYASTGRTVADIAARQSNDYMHWSGRVVAHSVAQFFGGIAGKGVFNIVNPLAMCLLVWLVARMGGRGGRPRLWLLALTFGLVWFVLPDQYVTLLMIAGSMNYPWATVLVLLFLLGLQKVGSAKRDAWRIAGLTLLALVAGAWSEMYAVCVLPALAVALWTERRRHPLHRAQWMMLLAYAAGAAFVVLAPGNFSRMEGLAVSGGNATPFGTRLVNVAVFVVKSPLPWLWLATVLLWIVQRKRLPGYWRKSCFLWVAIVCSIAFCVPSGAAWPRTHFPAYVFSIIMLLWTVEVLPLRRWMQWGVAAVVLLAVGVDFGHEVKVMSAHKRATDQVVATASAECPSVWTAAETSRKSISSNVLPSHRSNWRNKAFADYYGVPSPSVVPSEVMVAIKDGNMAEIATVGDYTVVAVPDSVECCDGLRLVFSDEPCYVYPSKMARLASAFGLPLDKRYYAEGEPMPLGGRLLKRLPSVEEEIRIPRDAESSTALDTLTCNGRRYIYYHSSDGERYGMRPARYEYLCNDCQ